MSSWLQRLAFRWLARTAVVRVADCVHFAGFRYGRGEPNPYENYLVALAEGRSRDQARGTFIAGLRHYRPRHLGEALGITLTREHPLWHYPWSRRAPEPGEPRPGWRRRPEEVPDIITYFSESGILRARIEEEFGWLESCLESIRTHGYHPERFAGDIQARRLVGADGATAYVIHDGNHRLAALAALGEPEARVVRVPLMDVREAELSHWPQVAAGVFSAEDARRVFRAYLSPRMAMRTTETPAPVIAQG